uniref:Uncharacterized protein n=1 Tax=Glossina morsitans morsitans TaxID=37546 RepID=A0A1B0GDK7_GLOMM
MIGMPEKLNLVLSHLRRNSMTRTNDINGLAVEAHLSSFLLKLSLCIEENSSSGLFIYLTKFKSFLTGNKFGSAEDVPVLISSLIHNLWRPLKRVLTAEAKKITKDGKALQRQEIVPTKITRAEAIIKPKHSPIKP